MTFATRSPSDLIRTPKRRHIQLLDHNRVRLQNTILYCRQNQIRCLFIAEQDSRRPLYLKFTYLRPLLCTVTSIMCFGPEEHEAIEITKSVMVYDIDTEVPILIINKETPGTGFSFVMVAV
jgi:hypothetical protein